MKVLTTFLLACVATVVSASDSAGQRSSFLVEGIHLDKRQVQMCLPVTGTLTCEKSCGPGQATCVELPHCYNPTVGESCCSDATYCPNGYYCTDAGCCPDSMTLAECGAEENTKLPDGLGTVPIPSSFSGRSNLFLSSSTTSSAVGGTSITFSTTTSSDSFSTTASSDSSTTDTMSTTSSTVIRSTGSMSSIESTDSSSSLPTNSTISGVSPTAPINGTSIGGGDAGGAAARVTGFAAPVVAGILGFAAYLV